MPRDVHSYTVIPLGMHGAFFVGRIPVGVGPAHDFSIAFGRDSRDLEVVKVEGKTLADVLVIADENSTVVNAFAEN